MKFQVLVKILLRMLWILQPILRWKQQVKTKRQGLRRKRIGTRSAWPHGQFRYHYCVCVGFRAWVFSWVTVPSAWRPSWRRTWSSSRLPSWSSGCSWGSWPGTWGTGWSGSPTPDPTWQTGWPGMTLPAAGSENQEKKTGMIL